MSIFWKNIWKQSSTNAEWVLREEAESEIEKVRMGGLSTWPSHIAEHCAKARQEGYHEGHQAGMREHAVIITNTKEANDAAKAEGIRETLAVYADAIAKARSDERERALKEVEDALAYKVRPNELQPILQRIRSRGTPSKESCDCPCHLGPFSKHGGDIPDHRPGSPCRCHPGKYEPPIYPFEFDPNNLTRTESTAFTLLNRIITALREKGIL